MGHETILEIFFENPAKELHIRGIAKELKLSKTAVSHHVNKLLKQKLITKQKRDVFPSFRANESNELYRFYKTQGALKRLIESDLIEHIDKELNPKCIILFGSFAKAEYDAKSDIDIFVQASQRTLSLSKYEKQLKHNINLLFAPDLNHLSPQLLNNILNGIKLKGFLKLK